MLKNSHLEVLCIIENGSSLFLFPPCIWANAAPTDMSVTVFTTKAYAIQNKELAHHIYFLDAVENLEE